MIKTCSQYNNKRQQLCQTKKNFFKAKILSLFSVEFNLLQLMFSDCMAAVKCRPVIYHCVLSGTQRLWVVFVNT